MMRTCTLHPHLLRRGVLAGAAVTAALVLSACGGGDSSSSGSGMDHGGMTPSTAASASTAAVNDADVTFAQSMIMHHRQAIEMTTMADSRAASPEVKDLAEKIKAAQQPEIDTMTEWLTAWSKPTPTPSMSMGVMPGMWHGSMPGMMSDADMSTMMDATGTAFDKMFLTMMITHHEGAIEMARQETAQGANPDAKALAEKIIADQRAEVTTMKGILARL